jgi:hypothetical protein
MRCGFPDIAGVHGDGVHPWRSPPAAYFGSTWHPPVKAKQCDGVQIGWIVPELEPLTLPGRRRLPVIRFLTVVSNAALPAGVTRNDALTW